jgi:GT2 family glycosyltransferase
MLLPKKALGSVGGYDNDYFAYWDELDLAVRMREKGFGVLIVPAAKVYHRGYASAERTTRALPVYYMTRNRILFMRKHARTAHLVTFSYMLLRNTAGSALHYASMRQSDVLGALFRGLRDGLYFPLKR